MNQPAIVASDLCKAYCIGRAVERATTLREALAGAITSPFRRLREGRGRGRGGAETFWALRDISFEVRPGQVLGIIGRNGAGKSTLLKILSRITEPTGGRARLRGRVASLLEVGTGFHPELTGRENVYLNGSLLGMSKAEVDRKFDEIVAFAGVEPFLDVPIKRYSSGMHVRLGFAVAAHLEPEILIIDEVLAVGDAEFQRKCLGRMQQISTQGGRTILFVSHNLAAVEAICDSALYLERGRIARAGGARDVVSYYLGVVLPQVIEGRSLAERTDRTGTGVIRFTDFHIEDEEGRRVAHVACGRAVSFVFDYEADAGALHQPIDVGLSVHSSYEQTLFVLYSSYTGATLRASRRTGQFRCFIPRLPLTPGRYQVGARMTVGGEEGDRPRDGVGYLVVEEGDFYGTGRKGCEGATSFLVDGTWGVQ